MPLASIAAIVSREPSVAFNCHVLGHGQSRGDLSSNPGQHADQGNMTADPAGVDRLGQCSRSADLNDSVNPLPGDSCCGSTPFRFALVVDQVVRAEILQTRQFFIGRRGGDDRRAGGLGDAKMERRRSPGSVRRPRLCSPPSTRAKP